jgi:hypothetical protein
MHLFFEDHQIVFLFLKNVVGDVRDVVYQDYLDCLVKLVEFLFDELISKSAKFYFLFLFH